MISKTPLQVPSEPPSPSKTSLSFAFLTPSGSIVTLSIHNWVFLHSPKLSVMVYFRLSNFRLSSKSFWEAEVDGLGCSCLMVRSFIVFFTCFIPLSVSNVRPVPIRPICHNPHPIAAPNPADAQIAAAVVNPLTLNTPDL